MLCCPWCRSASSRKDGSEVKEKDRLPPITTNYSLLEILGIPSDSLGLWHLITTSNHHGVSDLQDLFPEELHVHMAPDSAELSDDVEQG